MQDDGQRREGGYVIRKMKIQKVGLEEQDSRNQPHIHAQQYTTPEKLPNQYGS